MDNLRILILDLNPAAAIASSLREACGIFTGSITFGEESFDASAGISMAKVIESAFRKFDANMVFLGLASVPPSACIEWVQAIRSTHGNLPVFGAMSDLSPEHLLDLLKAGMSDFVTMPLRPMDIFPRILRFKNKAMAPETALHSLREKIGLRRMIGRSPAYLKETQKIPLVSKCDASVLITGETGTGKEMCARSIHYLSPRSEKPFVPVNCGAIPADLVENELFGHEREAFTGAANAKSGLIKEAASGTLFLDEIDSLPQLAQVKILRFLQEKEYRPLGSTKTVRADVRILAATNLPPEKAIAEGKMRKDLFYRLNIITIHLPPLRNRREDIPLLLEHFLVKYSHELQTDRLTFGPDALERLQAYDWPGNIRELEHAVQRAVLLADNSVLGAGDFPLPDDDFTSGAQSFQVAKAKVVQNFERAYIEDLLRTHNGNISRAALFAGKNRRAFWQLIQKHGIKSSSFRELPLPVLTQN